MMMQANTIKKKIKQPKQTAFHKRTRPWEPYEVEKDISVLKAFIKVYCHHHHATKDDSLCEECRELLDYARQRRERCPYDPKPKCKECLTHCYKPEYRQKIKEIMRYSGMYYVKRGRIDWLFKYFFSKSG